MFAVCLNRDGKLLYYILHHLCSVCKLLVDWLLLYFGNFIFISGLVPHQRQQYSNTVSFKCITSFQLNQSCVHLAGPSSTELLFLL